MLGPLAEDGLLRTLLLLSLYVLPSVIAQARAHHNRTAILLVNLVLGWTVLGWLAALVWSVTNPPPKA